MRILRALLISGTVSLLSTLSAATTKPFLTPFIMDISPANCSAATSHIVGSGTGINVFRTTVSADGRFHIGITFNLYGKGTDENGVNWTINDGDNAFSFNGFLTGGASEFTFTENFHLLSNGKTTNIVLHSVMKVKIAADGSTTLEFDKDRGNGEDCESGLIF